MVSRVTLVLTPRYPLLSLAICTEAMRVANRIAGRVAFDWTIASVDGKTAVSSGGMTVPVEEGFKDITRAPVVVLLSAYRPEEACHPDLLAWLRAQDRQGAFIACVDTAAFILAKAGVLGTRKAAIHHEVEPVYDDVLGDRMLPGRKAARDGRIASSAGGMATLDMVLEMIEVLESRDLADRVATVLNYPRLPDQTGDPAVTGTVDTRLGRMIDLMHRTIDEPVPVADIAARCGTTEPTALRLFRRRFGRTPGRYYMDVRLDRARSLLRNSTLSVAAISGRVGFASAGSLTRAYGARFGVLPSKDREAVSGGELRAAGRG